MAGIPCSALKLKATIKSVYTIKCVDLSKILKFVCYLTTCAEFQTGQPLTSRSPYFVCWKFLLYTGSMLYAFQPRCAL